MTIRTNVVVGLASAAAFALAAVPGDAASAPSYGRPALRIAAGRTVCDATPQNPHWSSGARDRRILFKTRVTCTGTYPSVTVRIKGSLQRGPLMGPKVVVAVSDQTQEVKNGKAATFYTPAVAARQVSTPGEYTGYITGQITAPIPGNLDGGHTKTVSLK